MFHVREENDAVEDEKGVSSTPKYVKYGTNEEIRGLE